MSLQYPSSPLNALDAKAIADDALIQSHKVETDAWLASVYLDIAAAAASGLYSVNKTFDTNTVNIAAIVKRLSTVLGYTTVQDNTNGTLTVDWKSAGRSSVSSPIVSNSPF